MRDKVTNSNKRKADALSRREASSVGASGRGALTGWTSCPLCGRHSQKKYAQGRGISNHLQAVHTPWNPGKAELRKRRRLKERARAERRQRGELSDAEDDSNLPETWTPSEKEREEWDAKILEIVAELETNAVVDTSVTDPTVETMNIGHDRSGKRSKNYRDSLPPFIQAAADGNLFKLQEMVAEAPSIEELVSSRDRNCSTAEHWAAGGGHLGCLRYLVEQRKKHQISEKPAKIRRRDGKTSLHYAARNGHLHCIRYLVEEHGYSLSTRSGDGTTPFHLACFGASSDSIAVVNYMVERETASIATTENDWGCTSAHWVAMTRCTDADSVKRLCSLLRSLGVSFTQVQKQGHSPLHKAAQRLNRHVIEWMLQTSEEGGAGLTKGELRGASKPDHGGHTPSEIWSGAGGDSTFASKLEESIK